VRPAYTSQDFNGCEFRTWLANQLDYYYAAESPIEALFAGALAILVPSLDEYAAPQLWPGWFAVDQQFQFGNYHVDVCLCAEINLADGKQSHTPIVAVECDGHQFHERTKEQAARDKKRDRWFAQQGICLFRFTGSEIFKSPFECAFEVIRHVQTIVDKKQLLDIVEAQRFAEVA